MPEESKYPECDKLAAVAKKSQLCGEFLDWLREQGWDLVEEVEEHYYPVRKTNEQLLAGFFKIDLNKVETERRALLEEIRANNERRPEKV
jgi:hypothetical protein